MVLQLATNGYPLLKMEEMKGKEVKEVKEAELIKSLMEKFSLHQIPKFWLAFQTEAT